MCLLMGSGELEVHESGVYSILNPMYRIVDALNSMYKNH